MKKTHATQSEELPNGLTIISAETEQPPEPDEYWESLLTWLKPKVKAPEFTDAALNASTGRARVARRRSSEGR